jgi:hypothetical protein
MSAYAVGDANLDGFVDGLDFIRWNANKFTTNSNWCDGDFNADGFVDGLDFIEWNANKFTQQGPITVPGGLNTSTESGQAVAANGRLNRGARIIGHERLMKTGRMNMARLASAAFVAEAGSFDQIERQAAANVADATVSQPSAKLAAHQVDQLSQSVSHAKAKLAAVDGVFADL